MSITLEPALPAATVPIAAPGPNAATRASYVCEAFLGSEAGPSRTSDLGTFGAFDVIVRHLLVYAYLYIPLI